MAERQLPDVPDILEANVFDSGMSIIFNASGRFRDIASLLVRNALSKSIIHAENRDPADTDQVSGLSQYWINTTTKARFFSVAGEDWVDVTPTGTSNPGGDGDDGDDGWTPEFANVADDNRIVQQIADWHGGGGTKPATGQYVGATGFVNAIADAIDIRGARGESGSTPDDGDDGDNGWSPELANVADGERIVQRVADWHGGSGTKPATGQYVGEDGFTSDIALAINIRGADGLDGDQASGEIGRILPVGSWTFGASTTPAAENAGYTSGNLYVHTTASDGDKTSILSGLAQGDYIHVGSDAILEITAAPTSSGSVYTLSVTLLEGAVPTSEAHTVYYIKENRALIAGSVHRFNIAAGAINLAKLAADVLTYWLRTVATDATLTGDGTTGSPLGVAVPADNSPPDVNTGMYSTLGSWTWTSTSVPATGEFYVASNEVRIFETDGAGASKATELGSIAVGDRLQIGGLNAFEVTALGGSSGNTYWSFTGNWAELFEVGDFDGDYTIRHIKHANVLARSNVVPGRFLKLNNNLLPIANDPSDSIETIWSGSIDPDHPTATNDHSLNSGKRFSDYQLLFFRVRGRNRPEWSVIPAVEFMSSSDYIEVTGRGQALAFQWVSDTEFTLSSSYGSDIQLQKIVGMRGA